MGILVLAVLLPASTLFAQEAAFQVRTFVPEKVGSKRTVHTKRTQTIDRVMTDNGKVVKQSMIRNELEFIGTIEVLEVDHRSQETRVAITIQKLTWTPNEEKAQEAATPGTVALGQRKEGLPSFQAKAGTPPLTELALLLLPRVTKLDSDQMEDDRLFTASGPQKAGSSWSVDKKLLFEKFKSIDPKLKEDAVSGSSKLHAVRKIEGKDHLDLERSFSVNTPGSAPAGTVSVELSTITKSRILIPADYSTGPVEESVITTLKRVYKGEPGTSKEKVFVESNTSDAYTTKTVYPVK